MATAVEAVSGEHVAEFLAHLQDIHRPSTCRTRYNALQRFFAWLVDQGEIDGWWAAITSASGAKARRSGFVRPGHAAAVAVRRYLRRRKSPSVPELFTNVKNEPLAPRAAKQMFIRRGREGGIKNCHPHKMRRTFALEFLESGGLPDDLRTLMGHTSQHVLRASTISVFVHRTNGIQLCFPATARIS